MYVRVNMVEFNSYEGMHEALTIWRKNAAQWMTGAQLLFTMKTSDKSAMYISVYKSQEDAENALDGRQKYVDAMGDLVHDVFYHEGDMDFAFLDPEMLKHEMVESL